MPLPAIPFLIKGAIVVGKLLFTKAAAAKATVVVAKSAVTHYGLAHSVALAATGLVLVGGMAWTIENVTRARKAFASYAAGDTAGAAGQLVALASSIKTVGTTDFAGDLNAWIDNGSPLDQSLARLVDDAKNLAEEAMATGKLIS